MYSELGYKNSPLKRTTFNVHILFLHYYYRTGFIRVPLIFANLGVCYNCISLPNKLQTISSFVQQNITWYGVRMTSTVLQADAKTCLSNTVNIFCIMIVCIRLMQLHYKKQMNRRGIIQILSNLKEELRALYTVIPLNLFYYCVQF